MSGTFKTPMDIVPQGSLLTFIKQIPQPKRIKSKYNNVWGLYQCACGNTVEVYVQKVKIGHTLSCGCLRRKRLMTHGLYKHPLFRVYLSMRNRCYGKTQSSKYYGARGVKICAEWMLHPEKFIEWALKNGWEKGKEIDKDKIPMQLGIPALLYSPQYCSILTRKENSLYKRNSKPPHP